MDSLSDVEFCCFLCSPEQTVEQILEWPVNWDVMILKDVSAVVYITVCMQEVCIGSTAVYKHFGRPLQGSLPSNVHSYIQVTRCDITKIHLSLNHGNMPELKCNKVIQSCLNAGQREIEYCFVKIYMGTKYCLYNTAWHIIWWQMIFITYCHGHA